MPDPDPNAATPPAATPPAAAPPAAAPPPAAIDPAIQARLEAAERAAEEGRTAAAELARIKAEQAAAEQKRLEEQGEWKTLAAQRAEEIKAAQRQVLTERVRSVAQAAGVIDPELADMIAVDDSFLVNGRPDAAKVNQAVEAFKTSKPHFFKVNQPVTRTGAGDPPPPAQPAGGEFDFRKLSTDSKSGKSSTAKAIAEADAVFSQAKAKLRR